MPAHTTLQATPTVLEVGVPGGSNGWLKIRAEMGEGGTVQASMTSTSHAGQEMLQRELPAMNAFLDREHVAVNLLVTHSPAAAESASVRDTSFSGGTADAGASRGEAGTTFSSGHGGGSAAEDQAKARADGPLQQVDADRQQVTAEVQDPGWSAATSYGGTASVGGSWLNVIV